MPTRHKPDVPSPRRHLDHAGDHPRRRLDELPERAEQAIAHLTQLIRRGSARPQPVRPTPPPVRRLHVVKKRSA